MVALSAREEVAHPGSATTPTTLGGSRDGRREAPPRLLVTLLAAAALGPVMARGGYTPTSRSLFVVVAGAALFAAIAIEERTVARFARSGVTVVLALMAVLSLFSAVWTIGQPADAFRAGLTTAGYAALAVAAATAVSRGGLKAVGLTIVGIAAVAALVGLAGVAFRAEPYAERIGGRWRPGGPFEYPPALALLQVCALPGVLWMMVRDRRPAATAVAALAGAAAAGVLALAASRGQLILAEIVLAAAVVAPGRLLGCRRSIAVGAVGLLTAAGVAFYFLEGGWVSSHATGGDALRLVGTVVIVSAVGASWYFGRPQITRVRLNRTGVTPLLALAAIVVAVALVVPSIKAGGGLQPRDGIGHGRAQVWSEAARTAGDRPIAGAGADAYLAASREHQRGSVTRFAHNLPLEFGAELGIAGFVLAIALYGACLGAVWRARRAPGAWIVVPAVIAFLVANLYDWAWHQAGAGAVFALALGATLALGVSPRRDGHSDGAVGSPRVGQASNVELRLPPAPTAKAR